MNWIALLIASVVGYIIPMIWYAPGVFGKTWQKLSGLKEMNPSIGIVIKGFIVTLVFNGVILWVIKYAGVNTFLEGMKIGAILWVGFIATSQLDGVLYLKKPLTLYWITSIQYLVSMIIVSGILAVWQ